jgi:BirA family biotin operon repressor/biotin-[acetyl-CoA-carboxylase] ligase
MAAALGVHSFLSAYGGEGFTIKWPNDLYWRDRKAAGILIENLWQGQDWRYSVIGMGVNVNQTDFGELGLKAVSLKQITGKSYVPATLAHELCLALDPWICEIVRDPEKIRDAYRKNLYRRNENVRFRKESRVFTARVKDVTENGELVVMHTTEEKFDVGEVEWIL